MGARPRRVRSPQPLAGLGAPRGGAAAPRGGGGFGAERFGVHHPGLPTHAAPRGGGGSGEGGGGGARPAPAQSPAAAEWPPASPQDPPPRLRRAAHRVRRARHGQLRQPHAAVRNGSCGRGATPSVSTAAPARSGRGPPTRHRRADGRAREGCAQRRAGPPVCTG